MSRARRVAFLGKSLPRRCGIATFTHDLQQAIAATGVTAETAIVAITDAGRHYEYPSTVRLQVHAVVSYLRALAEIRRLVRLTLIHAKPASLRALRAFTH